MRNALVFLPDHPLLHIALAGFETDPKRADFLRSFGLARLPKKSVVCTRAGEMLLTQQRPELALVAVDKALLADPKDLSAQRLRVKVLDAMPRLSGPKTKSLSDDPIGVELEDRRGEHLHVRLPVPALRPRRR